MSLTLVTIAGGHRLAPGPAASYERLCAAAGVVLPVTSAYRSTARQAYLYTGWRMRWPGFSFALPPGTSRHELGEAIDFAAAGYPLLEDGALAYSHGWKRTNPAERWHREYFADLDQHASLPDPPVIPAPPAPLIPLPQSQEDDMSHIIELLYLAYLNRPASAHDVLNLAKQAQAKGWTIAQLEAAFMTNHAESGTVVAAFRRFIGHDPSAAQIAEWSDTETIAQVWAGVGGSPEALARR